MASPSHYKSDSFGTIACKNAADGRVIVRDTRTAAGWIRPLARHLARREAAASSERAA